MGDEVSDCSAFAPLGTLDLDVCVNVIEFLPWNEILMLRSISKDMRLHMTAASLRAAVAPLRVKTYKNLRQLPHILKAFPGIEGIVISNVNIPGRDTYLASSGESPPLKRDILFGLFEDSRIDVDVPSLLLNRNIKILHATQIHLNGSYPALLQLKNLQSLDLSENSLLVLNLRELVAFRQLQELKLSKCSSVTGSLMDLEQLESLAVLDLSFTKVMGDIRAVKTHHFQGLKDLHICGSRIYGGMVQEKADAVGCVMAWFRLFMERPLILQAMKGGPDWNKACLALDPSSPDVYRFTHSFKDRIYQPPFYVALVVAGPRLGYRWINRAGRGCDIVWLDATPEPQISDEGYEEYHSCLDGIKEINRDSIFQGLDTPPSREQYLDLSEANCKVLFSCHRVPLRLRMTFYM